MDQLPDHARRLESLIRTGTVSAIDGRLVRVQTGGNLTDWLPWPMLQAGAIRVWHPPTMGERVTLLAESGELGTARILPGLPSEDFPVPSDAADRSVVALPGGARIEFDHGNGEATLTFGTLHIAGNLTVSGDAIIGGIGFLGHTHTDPQGGSVGGPQ